MLIHLERFLAWLPENDVTRDTIRTYGQRLRQFDRWLEAQGKEFTRLAFVQYLDDGRERGLKPKSIRPAFSAIRTYAAWLRQEGHDAPILEGIKAPAGRTCTPRYKPSDEQMLALWTAAKGMSAYDFADRWLRGKALVLLCLLACTAIRRCELLRLKSADVLTDGERWRLVVRKGKGKKYREIPVNGEAQAVLGEWFALRREWVKKHPPRAENPFLVPVDTVRPVGDNTLNDIIGRLNHTCGYLVERDGKFYPRITPHCIRHWATVKMEAVLRREGYSLKSISEILGHASTHTTEQYLHPDPEEMEALVGGISLSRPANPPRPGAIRILPRESQAAVGSLDLRERARLRIEAFRRKRHGDGNGRR